jgi:hypothetical protein
VRVQDLRAVRAVEAFDVRVLVRFARLDVVDRYAVRRAPIDKRPAQKLGTVVDPNR